MVGALVHHLRYKESTVAVLAVDPSSPRSGGALLGDRIRMTGHSSDPGVYIRSIASRGAVGGLAASVPAATRALISAGFDYVLVETVGVGQSEMDIARLADTTIVVLQPGGGDAVQAEKAGLLEVADILVVNKSDHQGADVTRRDLRDGVRRRGQRSSWRIPVLLARADTGDGVPELVDAILEHRLDTETNGTLSEKRGERAEHEVHAHALLRLEQRLALELGQANEPLLRRVRQGEADPVAVAEKIVNGLLGG